MQIINKKSGIHFCFNYCTCLHKHNELIQFYEQDTTDFIVF